MAKLILFGLLLYAGWWLLRKSPARPAMPEAEARAILGQMNAVPSTW